MYFLLLLILPLVRTQAPTPRPYNFPYNSVQFVEHKPAKKGPILFPNDGPPPPPTPLIVTSRPLSESIARSELNPNNSLPAQSQQYQVTFKPEYLARSKNYKPYSYTLATVTPVYDFVSPKLQYADNSRTVQDTKGFYKNYEKRLMESIYKNRETTKRTFNAWNEPVQQRRFEQKPEPDPELRGDKKINMLLENRDANYYNNDHNDLDIAINDDNDDDSNFDLEKVISERRHEFKKSINRNHFPNSITYQRSETSTRSVKRRMNSQENDKDIPGMRPVHNIREYYVQSNRNKRKKSNFYTKSLNDDENINTYLSDRYRSENLSGYKEKRDFNQFSTSTMPRKSIKNPEKLRSEYGLEVLRVRPVHSIEKVAQERVNRPLYEIADSGQRDLNTQPQSDRYKYQNVHPGRYNKYFNTNDGDHDISKEYNQGENYAFSYTVKDQKTGDDFSHSQQSTGTATNGEYRVRLPDGRMQVVSYTADENGYKADVRYDEHHTHDNSIDIDISKENRYQNQDIPSTYKYNDANTRTHHLVNQASYENEEHLRPRYQNDLAQQNPVPTKFPTTYNNYRPVKDIFVIPTKTYDHINDFDYVNDFDNKQEFQNNNVFQKYDNYKTNNAFVDTTKVNSHDHTTDRLSDNNDDYLEHYNDKNVKSNDKVLRAKDEDSFKFSDEVPGSKEIMDYSSELSLGYEPHRSKFSGFNNHENTNKKLVPSYEELKDLLVTNVNLRQNSALPIVVSTVRPKYDVAGDVVAITPKPNLYTNIRNIVPVTQTPYGYSTPSPTTPRAYLFSTIANLKHQINLANKPVLSHQYINKINKYLTYK